MKPTYCFIWLIILVFVLWPFVNFNNFILFKDSNFMFYQLLTYSFIHANFQHLLFNSIALLQIGYFAENENTKSFILQWIVFAFWGGLFSYLFEQNPVIWASWVVMWMFTYYYLKYKDRYNMQWVLVLVVINIAIWFMPWISLWWHLGWAISGALYYYYPRIS